MPHPRHADASTRWGVSEAEIGIFEYVSRDTAGIGGELKASPRDFLVNELRVDGTEVILPTVDDTHAVATAGADVDTDEDAVRSDGSVAGADADASDRTGTRTEGSDSAADPSCSQYVTFVLRKERWDTLGAIAELAELLGVPPRRFSFAGLKDHRAITTQEVAVRDVALAAVQALHHTQLKVGGARTSASKMRLGGCGGNRFRIRIRKPRGTREDVVSALRGVRKRGFVNYYGLQRFGSCALRNDEVGLFCLQWRYEEAVEALLRPRDGLRMSSSELEARECWAHSRNAQIAHRLMPKSRILEKELLRRLALEENMMLPPQQRARAAFLGLPLSQRRLFAHAYFSKVWNIVTSERLRRYGNDAARQGELVLLQARQRGPESDVERRDGSRSRRGVVHRVSASEAEAKAFDAAQVVLPLPGARARYPRDELGSLYRSLLAHDDVDPREVILELAATLKEGCDNIVPLQGDYRHIILRPQHMRWSIVSDREDDGNPHSTEDENGSLDVNVRFDLPPGAYATMALREAMKLQPPPSLQRHIRF